MIIVGSFLLVDILKINSRYMDQIILTRGMLHGTVIGEGLQEVDEL